MIIAAKEVRASGPSLVFARHETFHPRYGWLKKGFDAVRNDPEVFSREDAPVVLGVGKNMVRAIRYWCVAFKILEEDRNKRGALLDIAQKITNQLKLIRRLIQVQTKGTRSASRHENLQAEQKATEETKSRQEEGFEGRSDEDEDLPKNERREAIESGLVDEGFSPSIAAELAAKTLDTGLKYLWTTKDLETPAFFSVKPKGGEIIIILNFSHPAYRNLVEILDDNLEGIDDVELLKERLDRARKGLKLLLMAWARYEDEQPDGSRRDNAQDCRTDWGRIARDFLRDDND